MSTNRRKRYNKLPPTLFLLGTNDRFIPVATAEKYKQLMEADGNRCDLHLYEDQPHGFLNYGDGENEYNYRAVKAMNAFLADIGYL